MQLDVRIPIGLMFGIIGAILTVFGWLTNPRNPVDVSIYRRSLDVNVNLIWGLVLLLFSALMLGLARRAWQRTRKAKGP